MSSNKHSTESGSLAESKLANSSLLSLYLPSTGNHHARSAFMPLRFWTLFFMIEWEGLDMQSDSLRTPVFVCLFVCSY